jgi:hypothetical protein
MPSNRRNVFGEKLLDLANLAMGALVFGQLLSSSGLQLQLTIAGW